MPAPVGFGVRIKTDFGLDAVGRAGNMIALVIRNAENVFRVRRGKQKSLPPVVVIPCAVLLTEGFENLVPALCRSVFACPDRM